MYGDKFVFQNRLGQPYSWKKNYRFCFVLLRIQATGGAYIWRGDLTVVGFCVTGLGAYIWRGSFLEFYGIQLLRSFSFLIQPGVHTCGCHVTSLIFSEGDIWGWGAGGRDSHIKVTEMPVVSLMGVNCRIWFHLGCLGRKVTILAHLHSQHFRCLFQYGLLQERSYFKLEPYSHWCPLGFNFSFLSSIPISVIGESPQGTILGERLSEMVFIKNFNFFKMEIPIINF